MPGVVILAFSFFLPSYPLDHVSRLSQKQNARFHEKKGIDKGRSWKFVDYRKNVCYQSKNPNIDDFSTSSTKKLHKYIKNMKNTRNAPKKCHKYMECKQDKYLCKLFRSIRCNKVSNSKKLRHCIFNSPFLRETRTACQNGPKTFPWHFWISQQSTKFWKKKSRRVVVKKFLKTKHNFELRVIVHDPMKRW